MSPITTRRNSLPSSVSGVGGVVKVSLFFFFFGFSEILKARTVLLALGRVLCARRPILDSLPARSTGLSLIHYGSSRRSYCCCTYILKPVTTSVLTVRYDVYMMHDA